MNFINELIIYTKVIVPYNLNPCTKPIAIPSTHIVSVSSALICQNYNFYGIRWKLQQEFHTPEETDDQHIRRYSNI